MPRQPTFDNAIAFARDLIRIPSPSGEESRVAERAREELEALGFSDVRVDRWGNVVGVVRGTGRAPAVMLNAHLDVVHEGDPEEWEFPPYGGVVEGGYLHGRGAMDIKGPLAIQVYAAARLATEPGGFEGSTSSEVGASGLPSDRPGGPPPGDVIVALTVQEERGGLGLHRLLESWEEKPDAVILGEATEGDVTIGHRGRAELEVVIHGLAGHASAPDRARNALDLVGPVMEGIRELSRGQDTDPVLGKGTLVATSVEVSPETRNVIPDRAVVVVDWRVLPGQTPEESVRSLERAVSEAVARVERGESGPGVFPVEAGSSSAARGGSGGSDGLGEPGGGIPDGYRIEVRVNRERQTCYTGESEERALFAPGFLMDEEDPVVLAAARAVGRRNAPEQPARVRPWTFATDGGWSCGVLGIPTIGFAPGEEAYAHTNRERLSLDEARWALERYPRLIVAVQEALAGS